MELDFHRKWDLPARLQTHLPENFWLRFGEGFRSTLLDNGMVVVSRNIKNGGMTQFTAAVQAGTFHEADAHPLGTAHFLEHMPFRGTENAPGYSHIPDRVEDLGGEWHASVGWNWTQYTIKVPSVHQHEGLFILSEIVCRPLLSAEEIEKERSVIRIERKMKTISGEDWQLLLDAAFADDPAIGTRESLQSITRDDLLHFHQTHYHSGRVVVAAEGPMPHENVVELARQLFDDLPKGGRVPTPKVRPYIGGYSPNPRTDTEDAVRIDVLFDAGEACGANRAQAGMLTNILNFPRRNLLFKALRLDNFSTYHPSVELITSDARLLLRISYETLAASADKSLKVLASVMNDLIQNPQPGVIEELKTKTRDARNSNGGWKLAARNWSRNSQYLALATLNEEKIKARDRPYFDYMNVTAEDVQRAAFRLRHQPITLVARGDVSGMPNYETVRDMFFIPAPTPPAASPVQNGCPGPVPR
ncbi:MAG TPA: pitrilysin family protein [Alphaproteobacteria bacterium]|nr:pitrilysin family protein [Alphaproteobacteria bacterium]